MSQRLVVCADDFALNPGVSRAIAELARMGRISATSAMVCSPHWDTQAQWLKGLQGRISVGLHLDLTSPWAQVHGQSLGQAMLSSLLHLTDAATAARVIGQQLDRFEQVWQAAPDHIDGHQHVQQFAVWREALVQVVSQRYPVGQRPWLRLSQPMPADRGFKTWLIGAMGAAALQALAAQAQIPCSQYLLGITDFSGDADQWLRQAGRWLCWAQGSTGVVLMCHPGQANIDTGDNSDTTDGIASARQAEWAALSGPQWPALLQQHGITLVSRPDTVEGRP